MGREYNFIYSQLVAHENDLVGLIAYSMYKRHKIEFISSYREKNDGNDPTDADCRAFALSTCTPTGLKQYRREAEILIQRMILESAAEEIDRAKEDMLAEYREEIKGAITSEQTNILNAFGDVVASKLPKGWMSVLWSVIGAFVFAIVISLAYWIASSSEQDTVKLVSDVINAVKVENPSDTIVVDSIAPM